MNEFLYHCCFIGMIVGYSGALLAGGARASVGAQPRTDQSGCVRGCASDFPPNVRTRRSTRSAAQVIHWTSEDIAS